MDEFTCFGCWVQFHISLASFLCPCCAERALQRVDERVLCSMLVAQERNEGGEENG